jgi:predicted DNA-binding transcriptional regulator YafY
LLISQADQIEVVEPESVREEMHNFAKNILSYYEKEENQKCKE